MNTFFPNTGSDTEWNAAYYRLEDYLRAFHVVNKVHQNQIILKILHAAAARHAQNPELSPTTLALEEACNEIDEWFARILPDQSRSSVAGRVALVVTDAPEKWPTTFLAEEVPSEFVQAVRESQVQAGPDLRLSSMVPRPLDIGAATEMLPVERRENYAWVLPAVVVFISIFALLVILISW